MSKTVLFATSQIGFGGGERFFEDMAMAALDEGFTLTCLVPEGSSLARRMKFKCEIVYRVPDNVGKFDLLVANDFRAYFDTWRLAADRRLICHGSWDMSTKKSFFVKFTSGQIAFISSFVAAYSRFALKRWIPSIILDYGPRSDYSSSWEVSKEQARKELGLETSQFCVGNVARFDPIKRLGLFVDIAESLLAQGLLAVSKSFNTSREADAARAFGERFQNSRCISVVWERDPRLVYAAIDLFICTSERETLGIAMLEAHSFGVPVACLADGGVTDFIRPGLNGILIQSNETTAIVERIQTLCSDEFLDDMHTVTSAYARHRNPKRAFSQLIRG